MRDEFVKENRAYWLAFLKALFSSGIPERCDWTQPEEIVRVLHWLGGDHHTRPEGSDGVHNLAHLFYPNSGGNDLEGASMRPGANLIYMRTGENSFIEVRPIRLTFRSVSGKDLEWAYFTLETGSLPPCGVNEGRKEIDLGANGEEFFTLPDGTRITRGEYEGRSDEYSRDACHVQRFGSSRFVFWSKGSAYNQDDPINAYNAPHVRVSEEEFHRAICALAAHPTSPGD